MCASVMTRSRLKPGASALPHMQLGEMFLLRKGTDAGSARCVLWTHAQGWELRLVISGATETSLVCATKSDVRDTVERWRAALLRDGWQ